MPFTLELPDQYPMLMAVAVSAFFVNTVHAVRTVKFRKTSGIGYPATYASEEVAAKNPQAFLLNCAQRAHTNYLENLVPALGSMFISGLYMPTAAAAFGGAWVVSRVFYLYGYTGNKGPKGRLLGGYPSILIDFILKGMAAYTSYKFITAN